MYMCVLKREWGRVAALVLPTGGAPVQHAEGDTQGV